MSDRLYELCKEVSEKTNWKPCGLAWIYTPEAPLLINGWDPRDGVHGIPQYNVEYLLDKLKDYEPHLTYDAKIFNAWISFPEDDDGMYLQIESDPKIALLALVSKLIKEGRINDKS